MKAATFPLVMLMAFCALVSAQPAHMDTAIPDHIKDMMPKMNMTAADSTMSEETTEPAEPAEPAETEVVPETPAAEEEVPAVEPELPVPSVPEAPVPEEEEEEVPSGFMGSIKYKITHALRAVENHFLDTRDKIFYALTAFIRKVKESLNVDALKEKLGKIFDFSAITGII